MSIINLKKQEISYKLVYYGPSCSGKTTNIEQLHDAAPAEKRTDLQMVDTEGDRTLFFDQFDLTVENPTGLATRFMIYGVPGQSFYRNTRKMVLQGVDGVVFIADSETSRLQDNEEAVEDLKELLLEHQLDFYEIPLVIQYNKRDLEHVSPVEKLQRLLNVRDVPCFEASAISGSGVRETFKGICREVLSKTEREYSAQV